MTNVSIAKSKRAAERLPPEALPALAALLIEEDEHSLAAFSALHWNGATVESDATDVSDPTWYRVVLPGGDVIFGHVPGPGHRKV